MFESIYADHFFLCSFIITSIFAVNQSGSAKDESIIYIKMTLELIKENLQKFVIEKQSIR
jgi:hypothetical protein